MSKVDEMVAALRDWSIEDKIALTNALRQDARTAGHENIIARSTANEKYVGRCYKRYAESGSSMRPPMYIYYKIISARASAPDRVTVLKFPEYPFYWFEYQSHKAGLPGDYYLGSFELDGITTDEIYPTNLVDSHDYWRQIDSDDYYVALLTFIERLDSLKWPADHYRFGGKKPGDEGWDISKEKEKERAGGGLKT